MKSVSQKFMLMLTAAAMLAVLQSAVASAQTSGTGTDGYTRVLWQGADSSIWVWMLDGNLNYVNGESAGPFPGWTAIALAVGDDNYTRIVWKATDGEVVLWLLDPNLNLVSGYQYGPFFGWTPESTSVDSNGYERVIWRHTLGYMDIWLLPPDQSYVIISDSYSNPGYTPGTDNKTGGATQGIFGANGRVAAGVGAGRPLPKGMIPNFQKQSSPVRSTQ